MQVVTVLQNLEDGRKGPCWGYLKDGDVLTHVNDDPVNDKNIKEVVQRFNSSWKAVLGIIRVEGVLCPTIHCTFLQISLSQNISRWGPERKKNNGESTIDKARYSHSCRRQFESLLPV